MNEYTFELIFKLSPGEAPEHYLDVLHEARCDDALISTGMKGYLGLTFVREAKNAKAAIESAIKSIKQTIPHAKLERATPDLLNLSELAFLFQFTKQNMRKYARGEITSVTDDFPSPVVTGKTSYWHAAEVAQWLKIQQVTDISDNTMETLVTVWSLNQANEWLQQPDPDMTSTFTTFLQSVA